ncbi:MAG: hypothetical protein IJD67_07125 [Clostridia bacterium]|nr:hypothetical protein [Clostridia bacterium]
MTIGQKRIIITLSVIIIIVALASIWLLSPRAMFDNAGRIKLERVEKYVDGTREDITDVVDVNQIKTIISRLELFKPSMQAVADDTDKISYVVSLNYNAEQWVITLGEINMAYKSTKESGHRIFNSQLLMDALDCMS